MIIHVLDRVLMVIVLLDIFVGVNEMKLYWRVKINNIWTYKPARFDEWESKDDLEAGAKLGVLYNE